LCAAGWRGQGGRAARGACQGLPGGGGRNCVPGFGPSRLPGSIDTGGLVKRAGRARRYALRLMPRYPVRDGSGSRETVQTPTAEQVRTLAPDGAAARAGQVIADPRRWSAAGRTTTAAWGLCQGSGSSPYQTAADLEGPAYKCSCP